MAIRCRAPLEQAMERRLIGYAATDDGDALALVAEAQAVKPGSPSAIEVSLEAESRSGRPRDGHGRCVSFRSSAPFRRSCDLSAGVVPSIGADVGSEHPHMWGFG